MKRNFESMVMTTTNGISNTQEEKSLMGFKEGVRPFSMVGVKRGGVRPSPIEQRWYNNISSYLSRIITPNVLHEIISDYAFESWEMIVQETEKEIAIVSKNLDLLSKQRQNLLSYENSFTILRQYTRPQYNENYYDFATACFHKHYSPNEYSIALTDVDPLNSRNGTVTITLNNFLLQLSIKNAFGKQSVLIRQFSHQGETLIKNMKLLHNKIPAKLSYYFNNSNILSLFEENEFDNLEISGLHWQITKSEDAKKYFENYIEKFPNMVGFALVMCVFSSLLYVL